MGFFKPKTKVVEQVTPANDTSESASEAKETAAKKARLTETEGGNKGAELQAGQGKSVRRIFGG